MRKLKLFIAFFILFQVVTAQNLVKNLEVGFYEPETIIDDQTIDDVGNHYYKGCFKGALIVNGESIMTGNGGFDLFLSKTDQSGNIIWARNYGGIYDEKTVTRHGSCYNSILYKDGFLYVIWRKIEEFGSFDGRTVVTKNGESVFVKINANNGDIEWSHFTNLFLEGLMDGGDSWYFRHPAIGTANDHFYDNQTIKEAFWGNSEGTFNNNLVTKVNRDGRYLWTKRIESYYEDGTSGKLGVNILEHISLDEEKNFYLIANGSCDYLKIGDYEAAIDDFGTEFRIFKLDSSLTNVTVAPLSNWQIYNDAVRSDNLLYMLSINNFNGGDYGIHAIGPDLTVQHEEHLIFPPHFENTLNRIYINSFSCTNEYMFFDITFNGLNNSDQNFNDKNLQEVAIFKDKRVLLDLNGPSVNFIVKYDRITSEVFIKEIKSMEDGDIWIENAPANSFNGNYSFIHPMDEIWNPWIIDQNFNLIKGEDRKRDKNDNLRGTVYLSDGSKYIAGIAYGRTMFDEAGKQYNNSIHDGFVARLDDENNVIWYNRIESSYKMTSIKQLDMINDKLYFMVNSYEPLIKTYDNYIKIGNSVSFYNPEEQIVSYLVSIGPDGSSEIINLYDSFPSLGKNYNSLFNMMDETHAIFVYQYSTSNGGMNLPENNGTLIAKVSLQDNSVLDAIKIVPDSPYFPPFFDFMYDIVQDNLIIKGLNFNNAPVNYKIYNDASGTSDFLLSPVSLGIIRLDFESLIAYSELRIESSSRTYYISLNIIQSDSSFWFVSPRIPSGSVFYNDQKILDSSEMSESSHYNLIGKLNDNLQLEMFDVIPGSKVILGSITNSGQNIYVSGQINEPLKIDNLEIDNVSGPTDGITINYDDMLNAKKVYLISSPYKDHTMNAVENNDSQITFTYTSQDYPELIEISPVDSYRMKSALIPFNEINPSDKEEVVSILQVDISCEKKLWYRDSDGDGYGDPDVSIEECDQPIGYVLNNLDCDDTESTDEPCPCPDFTMGSGWGSKNTNNPLTDEWFRRKFPDNLTIGGINSITFTSSLAVKEFIPSGGAPAQLETSYKDPTKQELKNTFAMHLVILRLNMALNPGLKKAYITMGDFEGRTVQDLFNECNAVISNNETTKRSIISSLTNACDRVNHSFEDGMTGYVICESLYLKEKSGSVEMEPDNNVDIFPNPSKESFYIYKKTGTNIDVKVYDVHGRIIKQLTNIENSITEFGSELSQGLYIVLVSGETGYQQSIKIIKH